MSGTIIEFDGVTKRFGGIVALVGVSFSIKRGEIHALVGENGAGKSTLINLCGGVFPIDKGRIIFKGQEMLRATPQHSQALGIRIIHQEFPQCAALTVAENLFLGPYPPRRFGMVDRREMLRRARALFDELGVDIDPSAVVSELPVGQQQLVEIGKALSQDAELIIMDEPTSALPQRETEFLFDIIRRLKTGGLSIVYVSHRLREVFAICDRVSVLRDGRYVGTKPIAEASMDDVVQMMVGRKLTQLFPKETAAKGELLLEAKGLTRRGVFEDVDLALHRGEIVGIAGLQGSGHQEMLRALFGIDQLDSGTIRLSGAPMTARNPGEAILSGIGYVPADRRSEGVALDLSIAENLAMLRLRDLSRLGYVSGGKLRQVVETGVRDLNVKAPHTSQPVRVLSGGNQQKVILTKWLSIDPDLLILDDPTRGVDVGSKAEVYLLLNGLAKQGRGIFLTSTELPELFAMSDRLLVFSQGRIVGVMTREEANEERVMAMMTGLFGRRLKRKEGIGRMHQHRGDANPSP
jgi:ribose transport system ATP-binding protein